MDGWTDLCSTIDEQPNRVASSNSQLLPTKPHNSSALAGRFSSPFAAAPKANNRETNRQTAAAVQIGRRFQFLHSSSLLSAPPIRLKQDLKACDFRKLAAKP